VSPLLLTRPDAPAPPLPDSSPVDPEALVQEARRRQRKRRLLVAAAGVAIAGIGAAAYIAVTLSGRSSPSQASSAPVVEARMLRLHLAGWGTVVDPYTGQGPCPDGRTFIAIRSPAGTTIGSDTECVQVVSKTDVPNYGVRSTHSLGVETYSLPGGTIATRESRTFLFARDQRHT